MDQAVVAQTCYGGGDLFCIARCLCPSYKGRYGNRSGSQNTRTPLQISNAVSQDSLDYR